MKRRAFLSGVAAAGAVGLSACSGVSATNTSAPSGSAAGRQPLTMWFWGASADQQKQLNSLLVSNFNDSQPQYELSITYNDNVDKNVQTALSANQGPDVVYGSGPAFVSPYASASKIVSLDDYATHYGWKDKLLSPIYQSGTVEDKLYALTTSLSSYGIFYNQKTLTSNGWQVPTTQAELLSVMKAAQVKGMYATVTGNKGWQPVNLDYISLFLGSSAGPDKMYQALTGKLPWTDSTFADAVEQTTSWYKAGYFGGKDYQSLNFTDAMSLLSRGKSPFFIAPTLAFQFAAAYFNDAAGNTDDLGFTAFPNLNPTLGAQVQTIGTVNSLSINAHSKNPDGAAAVLDHILSSDFRTAVTKVWPGYWGVPLTTDFDATAFAGLSKQFATAVNDTKKAIDAGAYSFDIATFFPAKTLQDFVNIDSVWLGKQGTGDFLAKVQSDFNSELKAGSVPPIPQPKGAGG